MDTPVSMGMHNEFKEAVKAQVEKLEAEDKRLNERLKVVEETGRQISAMNITLQKQSDNIAELSKSINSMVEVQEAEGKRIKELEDAPIKTLNTVKVAIITGICSCGATAVVSAIIAVVTGG